MMIQNPDRPVGIRFLLLLIPLFAAVMTAAFGILYPQQIHSALQTLHSATPLANPPLCIRFDTACDPAALTDFAAIGTCTTAIREDVQTADSKIRLIAIDAANINRTLLLSDGSIPQNENECVVVPLSPGVLPAIGSTILLNSSEAPCQLQVVGIGENTLSALAPIASDDVSLLVYTISDTAWRTSSAKTHLLITDCTAADPYTAVQTLCRDMADTQNAYLSALAEDQLTAHLAAAEEADNAVLAQEIILQSIDNRLDTANLRAAELETNLIDAVAILQTEQQEFISDMQYNEYYALRQVDLIPRRDRAEEGYAKQEAAIDAIQAELHTAYAERDRIAAEHAQAQEIRTALQNDADTAHAALDSLKNIPQATISWSITRAEQQSGYAALTEHTSSVRQSALLVCAVAAAVFVVGCITVYSVSLRAIWSAARFSVTAILTAIPAVLFGGYILTNTVFSYRFPALVDTLTLPVVSAAALTTGFLLLLLTAVLTFLTALLGSRIHRNVSAQK